jgi:hypothetical protein
LGAVAVSLDGIEWHEFPCDASASTPEGWAGCAGWNPVLEAAPGADFLDPAQVGGDAFDIADLGVEAFRFVRIRDLSTEGAPPSAGFDLDAIAVR